MTKSKGDREGQKEREKIQSYCSQTFSFQINFVEKSEGNISLRFSSFWGREKKSVIKEEY